MTNQELAINTWLNVIGEISPAEERLKARALLARVQGKERAPGMPEAQMEPVLEAQETDKVAISDAPSEPEALPDDLHDLLAMFQ